MKKVKIAEVVINFIKSKHFWKLIVLIFLVGMFWSGWECKTKFFDFKKPQIKNIKR